MLGVVGSEMGMKLSTRQSNETNENKEEGSVAPVTTPNDDVMVSSSTPAHQCSEVRS